MSGTPEQTASVVRLAQELIRRPSRAGIDDYGPVLAVLEDWLAAHDLPYRRLYDCPGALVALLVEVTGGRPGPWWALDACVDTAPYGDEAAWSFAPACGDVVDGRLLGPVRRIRSQEIGGAIQNAGERGLVRPAARRRRESTRWGLPRERIRAWGSRRPTTTRQTGVPDPASAA
ncbi:hypothetical protein ABT063_44100 [Streptomyces sp. NPDC002838]|uniref:hypothetical protein n=1 Tax=Streptomyces sp. NPDC002838 TaxID=3154436 RepID=UPI00332E151C